MGIQKTSVAFRRSSQMAWFAALLLFSVVASKIVSWRVPGLDLQARNWLIRIRGPLPVPNDIAIVAIDETSLARFGRYPWRRGLMAQLVSRLAEEHPKAIALAVLFSETTSDGDDMALGAGGEEAGDG